MTHTSATQFFFLVGFADILAQTLEALAYLTQVIGTPTNGHKSLAAAPCEHPLPLI